METAFEGPEVSCFHFFYHLRFMSIFTLLMEKASYKIQVKFVQCNRISLGTTPFLEISPLSQAKKKTDLNRSFLQALCLSCGSDLIQILTATNISYTARGYRSHSFHRGTD